MTTRISSNLPIRSATRRPGRRSLWSRALVLSAPVALGLVTVPAAQGAPLPALPTSTCAKVSAASVGAVVGHTVPAGTLSTRNLRSTKANDEVSAVVTACIYGSVASLTALGQDVILGFEVTSRPLSGTELTRSLSQAQVIKIRPYAGLGMRAFYYTFIDGSIPIQGIAAIDGTRIYSSALYTKTPAVAQLAALVRLAEKL